MYGEEMSREDQAIARFAGRTKHGAAIAKKKGKARSTPPPTVHVDGAALLYSVHAFLGRFVAYPSEDAHVAHTLWVAHTHLMDAWESTPRIAFLSPEPGSGKTRALENTETLVPRPVEAINATPAYRERRVSRGRGTSNPWGVEIVYRVGNRFFTRSKLAEEVL